MSGGQAATGCSSASAASWSGSAVAGGFTYVGLLISVALAATVLAGTGQVWHAESRRLKERELLFVGEQYRRAIRIYFERSPGVRQFPESLEDLLRDPRYPSPQRYLRRLYPDPLTGKAEWGLILTAEGRIAGVYSLADGRPRKQARFPANQMDFEGKESYREWRFVYAAPASAAPTTKTTR